MNRIGQDQPWAEIIQQQDNNDLSLEALSQFIKPTMIRQVLDQTNHNSQRHRRLPASAVVWLVVGMGMFRSMDIPSVWRQIKGSLHSLLLTASLLRPPCKSSLSAARKRLGARPMRQLFIRTAKPIATNQTQGAFYHGMRLMAIDGVHFRIPDTSKNDNAFGRPSTKRNGQKVKAGYPQIHAVGLIEVGTHCFCEAVIKPSKKNEYSTTPYLLSKAPPNSLVLWDSGFYGYSNIAAALRCQVSILGRVKKTVFSNVLKRYPTSRIWLRFIQTHKTNAVASMRLSFALSNILSTIKIALVMANVIACSRHF